MANYDGRDIDDDHGHLMAVMIMVSVLRSNININIIYSSSSGICSKECPNVCPIADLEGQTGSAPVYTR
jgi:hypothetical protein